MFDPTVLKESPQSALRVLCARGDATGLLQVLAEDVDRSGAAHELVCLDGQPGGASGAGTTVTVASSPTGVFDCIDLRGELLDLAGLEAHWEIYQPHLSTEGALLCRIAGALGRLGLDDVRGMLALLPVEERTEATVEALLASLPPTHRLRRGPVDYGELDPDQLLMPAPEGQTLRQIVDWLDAHALSLEGVLPADRYDPAALVQSGLLRQLFAELSFVDRCVVAELLAGDMIEHVLVVRRRQEHAEVEEPQPAETRTAQVKSQYESFPYPSRDPEDERQRLLRGIPSDLADVNHYVFGGRRDFSKPFRALVAGGGTGDATVMLAQQLQDAGTDGEVVQVDLSEASLDIARGRVRIRGLDNVRFVQGSLLEVQSLDLGVFDYVDCCGVLHHLPDPLSGLRALVSVLVPDGGLGIMLYATLGRTGVYHLQDILRLIAPASLGDEVRLARTRALLDALPDSNWLRHNPFIRDHQASDTGRYDLLLHAIDRSYRVPEIGELCAAAGLRVVSFLEPVQYDANVFGAAPRLRRLLADMEPLARAAFAELFTGRRRKHVFQAVRTENPVQPPDPTDADMIPTLVNVRPEVIDSIPAGGQIKFSERDGALFLPVPPLARALMQRIDGQRSIDEIVADVCKLRPDLGAEGVARQFGLLYDTFNSVNRMLLSERPLYAASRK